GNATYKGKKFNVGITYLNTILGADFKRNPTYYNQFEFSSATISNAGINYSYNLKNFVLFGEAAASDNGGFAYVNGIMACIDPRFSVAVLNRDYQRNYQSLFGNAFAENTLSANEKGNYLAINIKLTDQVTMNTYYDRFSFS